MGRIWLIYYSLSCGGLENAFEYDSLNPNASSYSYCPLLSSISIPKCTQCLSELNNEHYLSNCTLKEFMYLSIFPHPLTSQSRDCTERRMRTATSTWKDNFYPRLTFFLYGCEHHITISDSNVNIHSRNQWPITWREDWDRCCWGYLSIGLYRLLYHLAGETAASPDIGRKSKSQWLRMASQAWSHGQLSSAKQWPIL